MPTPKRTGKVKLGRAGFVFHRDPRQEKRQTVEDEALSRKRLQYRGMDEFSQAELAELRVKVAQWITPESIAYRRKLWSTAAPNL